MRNVYFPDEEVSSNDLYFVCYMVERIARKLKQPNKYVVNTMGKRAIHEKQSLASVLHSENPDIAVLSSVPYKRMKTMPDGMIRVYNHPITEIIDDYNSSAYYEPSYVLTRSYWNGSFN